MHSKYKTRQRERLLSYFETLPGVHLTAADVCDFFKTQENPIGQSTIYRQLESLVQEGLLKKYILEGNHSACFEYVEPHSHQKAEICFHCKCEKCGKLIHLHCGELEELQSHLLSAHHFKPNPLRTVFYGLCEECY